MLPQKFLHMADSGKATNQYREPKCDGKTVASSVGNLKQMCSRSAIQETGEVHFDQVKAEWTTVRSTTIAVAHSIVKLIYSLTKKSTCTWHADFRYKESQCLPSTPVFTSGRYCFAWLKWKKSGVYQLMQGDF